MTCRSDTSNAVAISTGRIHVIPVHSKRLIGAVALATLAWTTYAQADICRVTDLGSTVGDGSDWGVQALTLQTALVRSACTEVWVRAGVYVPTTDMDPTISFHVAPGVAVYGGFNGTEVTRDARDPAANVTVLSGDIDGNDIDVDNNQIAESVADIQGTNSRRLVLMDGTTSAGSITASTVLDGFTITAGDYLDVQLGRGAGLYCNGSGNGNECSPTLRQLAFMANRAALGAALFNDGVEGTSSPLIDHVTFAGNFASSFGGAIYNYGDGGVASPVLTDVVLSDNRSNQRAGAMYNQGNANGNSSPILSGVTFIGNSTQNLGGATLNSSTGASGVSHPLLTNVTFSNNSSTGLGGAICNGTSQGGNSSPVLVNVTFHGNQAGYGGAIYNTADAGVVHPTYRNVILWGDSASSGNGPEIYYREAGGGSSESTMLYSVVEGGDAGSARFGGGTDTAFSSGTGNLDVDPLLGPLTDNGGATPTMLPAAGSAAVDAGTNTGCPATDQRGIERPQGPQCDIGAVEVAVDVIFADGFEQG